ncbi:MAG: hypothetical protein LWX83_05765 [Anaerolineae bacterium]|nr:hypothetical protein [Anaerolineae bacterium]
MEALLNDPIFIMLSVALVAALIYNAWQAGQRSKAWEKVIADTGFEKTRIQNERRKDDAITGTYSGRQISVIESSSPVYRHGKRKSDMMTSAATVIKVSLVCPSGLKLNMMRTSQRYDDIEKVSINDERIDTRFVIESEPAELVKQMLASEFRRDSLAKMKAGGAIYLEENTLVYDQTGRITDPEYIRYLMDLMVSLVKPVEEFQAPALPANETRQDE